MFFIFKIIVLFAIFGNLVHDCSELIGNYSSFKSINEKSCGISLFSSELKGCFKYHNEMPFNMKGSRNAVPGEAPWSVLLVFAEVTWSGKRIKRRCGGVLVGKRWVLTAAHCFRNPGPSGGTLNMEPIKVFVNPVLAQNYMDLTANFYGQWANYPDTGFGEHPKFKHDRASPGASYDVGLIKLSNSVPIDPGVVNTICLPPVKNFTYFEEEYAFTTGWNSFYNKDNRSLNRLQIETIKISSHTMFLPKSAPQWFPTGFPNVPINDSHFIWPGYIYGKKLGKQKVCGGDYGSPVWQYHHGRAVLIGIVSNANINSSDEECQFDDFTGKYANGTEVENLNETLSYISWVPMMMEWVRDYIQQYN